MKIITNDGYEFDNEDMKHQYTEEIFWNGFRAVGKSSGMGEVERRQILYTSDKGCYFLLETTLDNKINFAFSLNQNDASKWLAFNNHKIPSDL